MKKHIAIAAGLAVLSTSAFATKSRMEALGQSSSRGSFFIEDTRNIFRNASKVNDMTNYVVTEWGTDSAAQNAEGGFFRSAGQFNYGLYLNSDVNSNASTQDVGLLDEDNRLQLFVGGDMGLKWGASVYYSSSENEQGAIKKENDTMGVSVGVSKGAMEGYANVALKDESKGGTAQADKFDADSGMLIGAAYSWMDYKFYAEYAKDGYEQTVAGAKKDNEFSSIVVGVGHNHEVSATSRIFTQVQYETNKDETTTAGTKVETKNSNLPLTIGFEADATSWLALRGSISQNIVLGTEKVGGKKKTNGTTDVAAGATLNFGKLKVDGMIGTTSNDRTAAAASENGTLALDNVMTKVAVHYWF